MGLTIADALICGINGIKEVKYFLLLLLLLSTKPLIIIYYSGLPNPKTKQNQSHYSHSTVHLF